MSSSLPPFFVINSPAISHETLAGEVVIVNLVKGHYYCLEGTGAQIWELIAQKHSYSAILSFCLNHYEGSEENIEKAVESFVQVLLDQGIVISQEKETSSSLPVMLSTKEQPFIEPILNIYTDMEELLLLDSIHEVDETELETSFHSSYE